MRRTDPEYATLTKVVAELRGAEQASTSPAHTETLQRIAYEAGALKATCRTAAVRIECLLDMVNEDEAARTVYDRARDVLDERARYEREEGDMDEARLFFEVDLHDADDVDDLLRWMNRKHWSHECDEYAVVWAIDMAHRFCAMMEQLMLQLEEDEDELLARRA